MCSGVFLSEFIGLAWLIFKQIPVLLRWYPLDRSNIPCWEKYFYDYDYTKSGFRLAVTTLKVFQVLILNLDNMLQKPQNWLRFAALSSDVSLYL